LPFLPLVEPSAQPFVAADITFFEEPAKADPEIAQTNVSNAAANSFTKSLLKSHISDFRISSSF
jgi:hypothetical protein